MAMAGAAPVASGSAAKKPRPVYFPECGGFVDCRVHDRYRLAPGVAVRGPAVIEERETTVILLPDDEAVVDRHRNLVVEIGSSV